MLLKTTEWQTDRQSSTQRCCHNDAMQIRNDSSAGHVRGRWAWNLGAGLRSALVKRFDNSKQASDGTNCPTNENGTTVNHLCCRSAVCMQRMLMHIQALDMKCYFKVRSVYHTERRYIRSRLWPTNFSEPMNIQNRWNDVTSAACLALRRESRGDLVFSKSQDHQARELSLALLHDGDVPGYWFNDGDVLWPPSTTIQRKVILCRRRSTQLYTFSRQMEFLKLGWHKYTLAAESSSAHAPSKHHNQHKLGTGVRRPHALTDIHTESHPQAHTVPILFVIAGRSDRIRHDRCSRSSFVKHRVFSVACCPMLPSWYEVRARESYRSTVRPRRELVQIELVQNLFSTSGSTCSGIP